MGKKSCSNKTYIILLFVIIIWFTINQRSRLYLTLRRLRRHKSPVMSRHPSKSGRVNRYHKLSIYLDLYSWKRVWVRECWFVCHPPEEKKNGLRDWPTISYFPCIRTYHKNGIDIKILKIFSLVYSFDHNKLI